MEVIVDFIDENKEELGVEPICKELQVATSTYYAARSRPLSARAARDALLVPMLMAIWEANYRVYGVRKLWRAAQRAGHDIGRDQVARLMDIAGIEGLRRGKKRKTTRSDPGATRHPDLVQRAFSRRGPEPALGERSDLCGHVVGLRLRVLHHRRLLAHDRGLAGGFAHAHRHGP